MLCNFLRAGIRDGTGHDGTGHIFCVVNGRRNPQQKSQTIYIITNRERQGAGIGHVSGLSAYRPHEEQILHTDPNLTCFASLYLSVQQTRSPHAHRSTTCLYCTIIIVLLRCTLQAPQLHPVTPWYTSNDNTLTAHGLVLQLSR